MKNIATSTLDNNLPIAAPNPRAKKTAATIILNRNLPDVADSLWESLRGANGDKTDIFVVEAGSDKDKLSRHCTWWANWDEAMKHGLRVPRGFNYGLSQLWKENKFLNYDFFFLMTNDAEFEDKQVLSILLDEMKRHPRVGVLSPCSRRWGERYIIGNDATRYFWDMNSVAYIMRREFVQAIMAQDNPDHMNFLYDGTNFFGYGTQLEMIAKGYANDWAAAITTKVWVEENEAYLKTKADLIKTEPFEVVEKEYVREGIKWMHRKYGFSNHWTMQMYAKLFYEKFFEFYPEFKSCRI